MEQFGGVNIFLGDLSQGEGGQAGKPAINLKRSTSFPKGEQLSSAFVPGGWQSQRASGFRLSTDLAAESSASSPPTHRPLSHPPCCPGPSSRAPGRRAKTAVQTSPTVGQVASALQSQRSFACKPAREGALTRFSFGGPDASPTCPSCTSTVPHGLPGARERPQSAEWGLGSGFSKEHQPNRSTHPLPPPSRPPPPQRLEGWLGLAVTTAPGSLPATFPGPGWPLSQQTAQRGM